MHLPRIIRAALGRSWRRALAGALSLVTAWPPAAGASADAAQPGYELGHGLRLGTSGLTLGGYATLEYERPRQGGEQLKSGHASAFVWWEALDRVKVFGELDLVNTLARRRDEDRDERRVSLERLYADFAVGDTATLRAGKFLTPIGRWNAIHADPLVWTTSRPLVTQVAYPQNIAGLLLSGSLPLAGQASSISVYGANGAQWRGDARQDPFASAGGLRIVLPLSGDLQLGASVARYQRRSAQGDARTLGALDLLWARDGVELSAEWLQTSAGSPAIVPLPDGDGDEQPIDPRLSFGRGEGASRGGYVQGVVPVFDRVFAVARAEWLQDASAAQILRLELLGLTWRPVPGAAVKFEFAGARHAAPSVPQGLRASVSVLF